MTNTRFNERTPWKKVALIEKFKNCFVGKALKIMRGSNKTNGSFSTHHKTVSKEA